jgi:hypothetical protein
MRETPLTAVRYSLAFSASSKNPTDMGTIRREGPVSAGNPQRLYVWGWQMQLIAEWITGFVDGEGCFHVGINDRTDMKAGCQVLPEFTVVQHKRDVKILHALKAHFGCGVVRSNHGDRMAYRVRGLEHLRTRIIPFFEKHSLKTSKRQNFMKFRRIVLMLEQGVHLTPEGVTEIRRIAGQMNRGQS